MREIIEKSRLNSDRVMSCRGMLLLLVAFALLVAPLPLAPARAAGTKTTPAVAPSGAAAQNNAGTCSTIVPPQGDAAGAFSDAEGWTGPEYYSTIQLADVDGDGQDELLARGGGGIFVSQFDKQKGRWGELRQTSLLSDASGGSTEYVYGSMRFGDVDGVKGAELIALDPYVSSPEGLYTWKYDAAAAQWQQLGGPLEFFNVMSDQDWSPPEYYSTLRLADIDGDGQAEFNARAIAGLYVFHWNKATSSWDTLSSGGILSDAGFWNRPEYYETIQFANIDGDQNGAAELLVRGSAGLHTYRWDAEARAWNQIATLTELSDPNDWNLPQYYKTIRAADVDGDGAAEVVARGSAGAYTWRWDQANSAWNRVGKVVDWFSDAGYWYADPRYYATIKLADVNGDKGAELLGRAQAGMSAFTWDKESNDWRQIINPFTGGGGSTSGVMGNARGWTTPDKYETIRYGDVDGDGSAELIGRSAIQIETWRLAPTGDGFVSTLIPGFFPAFTGDQLTAYQYISGQLLDGAPNADIRSQYRNQLLVQNFGGEYLTKLNSLSAPAGVSANDFEAVRTQLETEFGYVTDVNQWFANQSGLITKLNESDILSISIVAGKLQLSEAANDESATLNLLSLITNVVSAIAGLAGQPEVSAVVRLVSLGFSEGAASNPGGPDIQAEVNELQEKLDAHFSNSVTANGCLLEYHMRDWELLQSLGQPIAQGTYNWDDTLTGELLAAGRRGYEITLWQTLTPLVWEIDNTKDCWTECSRTRGCVPVCAEIPSGYPQEAIFQDVNFIYLQTDKAASPSKAIFDNLLNAPANGGLGVPLEDVFLSKNGWKIPGNVSGGDQGTPPMARICFRAPDYYLNHLNTLPPGQVVIAGEPQPVSTESKGRMWWALRGGRTIRQQFNQHFVAAQLSVLAAPGADQQTLRRSRLSSYGLVFEPVQVRGVTLSLDSTLDDLLVVSKNAAQYGSRDEQRALAEILGLLNSDDPGGACGSN